MFGAVWIIICSINISWCAMSCIVLFYCTTGKNQWQKWHDGKQEESRFLWGESTDSETPQIPMCIYSKDKEINLIWKERLWNWRWEKSGSFYNFLPKRNEFDALNSNHNWRAEARGWYSAEIKYCEQRTICFYCSLFYVNCDFISTVLPPKADLCAGLQRGSRNLYQ